MGAHARQTREWAKGPEGTPKLLTDPATAEPLQELNLGKLKGQAKHWTEDNPAGYVGECPAQFFKDFWPDVLEAKVQNKSNFGPQ